MNAPAPPPLISPSPSPEEAAAIVAAIECFAHDTAPAPRRPRPAPGGWLSAARAEAVGGAPGPPAAPSDRRPWREGVRTRPH